VCFPTRIPIRSCPHHHVPTTLARHDVIRQRPDLLHTDEVKTISTYRYEVDGKRRKVRRLLFIWD